MKKILYILLATALIIIADISGIQAQESTNGGIEFTSRVHNFGKISISEGAKHCTFEFKNTSNKPVVINNIITSCGCTTPNWPKKPIMPGESGKVEVTYLNDQGPYPFDKSLTVYTSASSRPIILRITGLAYENERSMKDMFPVTFGPLGVKNNVIRGGQIAQGNSKKGSFTIANISNKDVKLLWENVSKGLKLSLPPKNIVKANSIEEIEWEIDTKAETHWGNTTYSADVMFNGIKASTKLEIETMIIDNFSTLTKEEKNKASMVLAENSSFDFGTVKKGEKVKAHFNLRNTGHSPLVIHKIECTNIKDVEITSPKTIQPGEKVLLQAVLDTSACNEEAIYTITLVTNSPNRPLVNLFIVGKVN